MTDDKKKELPSCVVFGMRYWKSLRSKLDKIGYDWMTPKAKDDWFLACSAYEMLFGLVNADNDAWHDYKLFILLGYKLIDLVSSVNFELKNCNNDKEN